MENRRISLSDTQTSLLDTCLGSAVLRYREIAAEMLAAEQSKGGGNLMGFYRQFARQADDAESLRLRLAEAGAIWLCEDAEAGGERYRVAVIGADGHREESDITPDEIAEMSQGENEYLSLYCGTLKPGEVHRSGGGASPTFEITRL